MRHTIVCLAGRKIEVQPCAGSPGNVLLQVFDATEALVASVTLGPVECGFLLSAIETEGVAAELSVHVGHVVPMPSIAGFKFFPNWGQS